MPEEELLPEEQIAVLREDRTTAAMPESMHVTLVLDRLRSAFNVGNIFRLADAARAESIVTCGYTASPPHPKLAKTARGCDQCVPSRSVDTAADAIQELKADGFTVYAVETVSRAQAVWDTVFQFPAALVFGNEALGISKEALGLCDEFVMLPCLGVKNSINVGNCAAVVLYRAFHQWIQHQPTEQKGN